MGRHPFPAVYLPALKLLIKFFFPNFILHRLFLLFEKGQFFRKILLHRFDGHLGVLPPALLVFRQFLKFLRFSAFRQSRKGGKFPETVLPILRKLLLQVSRRFPEFRLNPAIDPGIENFPENLFSFLGRGQEKPQKIALGNHGDLKELAGIQAYDLGDLFIRLRNLSFKNTAVGKGQLHARALPGQGIDAVLVFSPAFPLVGRISPYRVAVFSGQKRKFHIGRRLIGGILAPHHLAVPLSAAGLVKKTERNGVKKRGLSRSGVPGDEKNAASDGFKIHDLRPAVGTEGR